MKLLIPTYDVLKCLKKHRRLLYEMAKRDVSDRYAGQMLGTIWAIINPVLTISVFVILFGVIFRLKASSFEIGTIPQDHTIYMLSGLIPWLVASDVMGRSPSLIVGQTALVKQVVFPLEILPAKMVLSTLPMYIICLSGLYIYTFILYGFIPMSFLGVVPASLIMYTALFGLAYLLSSFGVLLRDTKDIVGIYIFVGLYMAPVFYYLDWVPTILRTVIYLNPATWFIKCFQDAFFYEFSCGLYPWLIASGLSMFCLLAGCCFFIRFKHQFGNFI